MPNLGPLELTLIIAVILLLFGAKKLPELARGLGQGLKEFKTAVKDNSDEETKPASTTEA